MRAPKHLWAGDWQRESAALSDELDNRPAEPREAAVEPEPPRPDKRRQLGSGLKRALAIALVVLLGLAAGAYGLTAVLGSQKQAPAAALNHSIAPVYWLGMQIESLPPGAAVIETVALGSPAEAAGLEPGDVIAEVNGRPVSATAGIAGAISGLRMGDAVELQINRGSTQFATRLTLTAPPSSHP